MPKLFVIGPREFLLGFGLAGLKKTYASEDAPPEKVFTSLLDEKQSGVMITDKATFESLDERLQARLQDSIESALVVVTEGEEAGGGLRKKIKLAMGVDVWGEEKDLNI